MLKRLRRRLLRITARITNDEQALEVARNRWKTNHMRAVRNHHAGIKAKNEADRLEASGQRAKADLLRAKAQRCGIRAWKSHLRAEWWVGRIKELHAKIEHLEESKEQAEARLEKLIREAGARVDFENNRVYGGTDRQRIRVAMHVSMQRSIEFYSQVGTWSARYFLTGPPWGYHFDCSSWFISGYWTCGLADPSANNFNGGWTGPLGEHGIAISESELDSGDAILFGYAPFEHVEMKDGPMSESPYTGGHGDSAVNRGTVNLIPGPRSFRRYIH